MESLDENLAIDLIKNQNLSYEQASGVLKDFLLCVVFHLGLLEDFVAKGVSLRVSTEKSD